MIRVLLMGLLLVLIARAFWKLVNGVIAGAGGREPRGRSRSPAVKLVRDPVCGTFVSPGAALSLTSGGRINYFCSEECRAKFKS